MRDPLSFGLRPNALLEATDSLRGLENIKTLSSQYSYLRVGGQFWKWPRNERTQERVQTKLKGVPAHFLLCGRLYRMGFSDMSSNKDLRR